MPRFIYDGETFDLIQRKFTFGESSALEKVTGLTMGQIQSADEKPEYQTTALMQGTVWVSIKRKRPTFLFEELEDVGMDEDIEWLEEPDEEAPEAGEVAPVGPTSPGLAPGPVTKVESGSPTSD